MTNLDILSIALIFVAFCEKFMVYLRLGLWCKNNQNTRTQNTFRVAIAWPAPLTFSCYQCTSTCPHTPLKIILKYKISFSLQWRHNKHDGVSNHTALRLFIQPFIQAQIKENIKALRHWPLSGEFTGDRWIPRTNGQSREKCFHSMTSSCVCFLF